LQTGLRPILMNLADPKRLSIPGLEGLARLLELLTNYFKVEIGHKLLDHFRFVADPEMLQASSKLPLQDNEGIIKLVRITNIFHLLPSTANMFLENLVTSIVQIETQMEFSGPSPFSPPLAKYLDRYPVDAMDFFMRNLHLPRTVRTVRSILEARLAPRLMRELVARASFIVTHCLQSIEHGLIVPGLLLCKDMASQVPTLFTDNQFLVDGLVKLWRTHVPSNSNDLDAILDASQRTTLMITIFLKAMEHSPRIDILFEVTAAYMHNLPIDTTRLSHFLYQHAAMSENLTFRRNILLRFFTWFEDSSYSWTQKTHFIRLIVTPMLLVHATRSEDKAGLIDENIIKQFHLHIWQPMNGNTAFGDADDMFRIELLHLTTIMVQHYSQFLVDVQKAIIMGAWHYITSEDVVVKYTAYLLAARFFDSFPSPEKFVVRAWTGLLRPPHSEGRSLIRQALDVLAPALPRSQTNESGYPQWAKTTRRLLAEEGNGMSQILIIYQLIVRQRQLFYPVRAVFIPHMVNSLVKLGLSGSATNESRLLSIEVVQVIFDWEQKSTTTDDDMAVDEPHRATVPWVTPIAFRESMVSYLVRLATTLLDQQIKNILIPRALSLLRSIIAPNGWNDVTVKLHYFSRALEQVMSSECTHCPLLTRLSRL
jgi:transformation/transcription domain-associated protein